MRFACFSNFSPPTSQSGEFTGLTEYIASRRLVSNYDRLIHAGKLIRGRFFVFRESLPLALRVAAWPQELQNFLAILTQNDLILTVQLNSVDLKG